MKRVHIYVRGPGSGRETAIRALGTGRHHGRFHQRHYGSAAQWVPPAETPPRLT